MTRIKLTQLGQSTLGRLTSKLPFGKHRSSGLRLPEIPLPLSTRRVLAVTLTVTLCVYLLTAVGVASGQILALGGAAGVAALCFAVWTRNWRAYVGGVFAGVLCVGFHAAVEAWSPLDISQVLLSELVVGILLGTCVGTTMREAAAMPLRLVPPFQRIIGLASAALVLALIAQGGPKQQLVEAIFEVAKGGGVWTLATYSSALAGALVMCIGWGIGRGLKGTLTPPMSNVERDSWDQLGTFLAG